MKKPKKTMTPYEAAHHMIDELVAAIEKKVRGDLQEELSLLQRMRDELANSRRIFLWASKIVAEKGNPSLAEQLKYRADMCAIFASPQLKSFADQLDWNEFDKTEREWTLKRIRDGNGWGQPYAHFPVDDVGQYKFPFA